MIVIGAALVELVALAVNVHPTTGQ